MNFNESSVMTIGRHKKKDSEIVVAVVFASGAGTRMGIAEHDYMPDFRMNFNNDQIKALDWSPTLGLKEMFAHLLEGWR